MGTFVFLNVCDDGQMNANKPGIMQNALENAIMYCSFCNLLDTTGDEIFKFKCV